MSKWEVVRLGDICELLSGFAFDSNNFTENIEDVPLIRIRDIVRGYTNTYYSGIYDEKYLIKKGDFLIGMDGEFNIAEWKSENALLNQRICKITCKSNVLHSRYLFFFLPKALKNIESKTSFVTVKHLSTKSICQIQIPLPPIDVQKKIARTLDAASELIALRKKQLVELDNLIKSTFYDMFGDPTTNVSKWDYLTLKQISKRFSDGPFGSNLKTEHYSETGIRVIRLQNIGINEFLDNDEVYVDESHYNEVLKKYTCYPGDIVIATMGTPNIRACIIPNHVKRSINKADCVLCRPEEMVNNRYIVGLINSPSFLQIVSNLLHGQTRTRVSMGQLAELSVPIPPLSLQNQFAEIFTKIEEQKALVQKAIDESQYLFDSLMRQYFE